MIFVVSEMEMWNLLPKTHKQNKMRSFLQHMRAYMKIGKKKKKKKKEKKFKLFEKACRLLALILMQGNI